MACKDPKIWVRRVVSQHQTPDISKQKIFNVDCDNILMCLTFQYSYVRNKKPYSASSWLSHHHEIDKEEDILTIPCNSRNFPEFCLSLVTFFRLRFWSNSFSHSYPGAYPLVDFLAAVCFILAMLNQFFTILFEFFALVFSKWLTRPTKYFDRIIFFQRISIFFSQQNAFARRRTRTEVNQSCTCLVFFVPCNFVIVSWFLASSCSAGRIESIHIFYGNYW